MTQLLELAKPFAQRFIHTNPSGGGSYVKHHVVNQKLILALNSPPSFRVEEIIRGDVDGYTTKNNKVYPDLKNVIVGVVAELSCEIDGQYVLVQEAGDCEQPHNWNTDGARLKDAMSDAYKRCAMRLGCGLHLWSQDEFILYDQLRKRSEGSGAKASQDAGGGSEPAAADRERPPASVSPEQADADFQAGANEAEAGRLV